MPRFRISHPSRVASWGLGLLACCLPGVPMEAQQADPSVVAYSKKGPWGELEYFPIALEPPDHFVAASGLMERPLVWHFPGKTLAEVTDILSSAGVDAATVAALTPGDRLAHSGETLSVYPPMDLVEALPKEPRQRIYEVLRKWDENELHRKPFPLFSDGLDLMVHGSGMSADLVERLRHLSYRWGAAPCFSDLPILLSHAGSEPERWRIAKTIMRAETLLVRLRLSSSSDLDSIMTYWASPTRHKNLRVFAEPLTRMPGVNTLDIVHLLPPTPRKLLYTYPSPLMGVGSTFPDCFWTAFNFFSYEPTNRYLDTTSHRTFLTDDKWEKAKLPPRFGDVIIIADGVTNEPIHACNYIADDIVFTKNGQSLLRPFVLSKLDDVLKAYLKGEQTAVSFYRLKPPVPEIEG